MARTGISKEQVTKAIEALIEDNHPVTVSSIRDHLGSGSYSTISTHLAKWREDNDSTKIAGHPDIPENVDKAFRSVWATAWKMAQEDIQSERETLAVARSQMEQEKRDMTAEISRLEIENTAQEEQLKQTIGELFIKSEELTVANNIVNDLRIENARLDERVKSAEGRAGELKEELDKLHIRFKEVTEKMTERQKGK